MANYMIGGYDVDANKKIYQGPLYRKKKFGRWQNIYCILFTRKLCIYNDKKEANANSNKAKETLELSEVTSIINDRSNDDKNKNVFELLTLNSKFTLACLDLDSLSVWIKFLNQQVFGNTVHYGWLIKKGQQMRNWRKRFFVLSDFKELRYYEDETKTKAKGIIALSDVSIIRHGDKATYGYEYTIEITTPDRTWVLVTTYHELRELWMDKLGEAIQNGIRMKLSYEGNLWKFEPDKDVGDWSKKYYGIDNETMNLYYVKTYNHFKQFASTLFFDKMYYLEAVDNQLQGAIPIKHAVVEEYGNNDKRFDDTSQNSNPWIFKVSTVVADVFFACDTELQMKEWILHMNLAQNKVNAVTIGGPNDYPPSHENELRRSKTSDVDEEAVAHIPHSDKYGGGLIEEEPAYKNDDYKKPPKPPTVRPFGGEAKEAESIVHIQPPKWKDEVNKMAAEYKKTQQGGQGGQVIITDPKPQNNSYNNNTNHNIIYKQPQRSNPQPRKPPPFDKPNRNQPNRNPQNGNPPQNMYQMPPVGVFPIPPMGVFQMPPMDPKAIAANWEKIMKNQQPPQNNQADTNLHDKELNAAQDDINKKYNVRLGATELAFIANWTEAIAPFKNRPSKLEAQAAFPCAFDEFDYNNGNEDEHDPIEIHQKCGCVHRISLIIDYYINWIYNKQTRNTAKNDIGMSNLVSTLQDYSMTELLNDFFHIKRFHAEGVSGNKDIAPVAHYFAAQYGVCNVYNCLCLERNNRSEMQCRDLRYLRGLYFINMNDRELVGTSLEIEEYVTQHILDMIHCYVFHGSFYSLYPDSTTPQELATLREIYSKKKAHFKINRYMTNIHSFHHIPYKPFDVATPDGNHANHGNGYQNNNNNQNNGYDNNYDYNPLMPNNGYQHHNKVPEGPASAQNNGHNNGYNGYNNNHNNNKSNGTHGGSYNNGGSNGYNNGSNNTHNANNSGSAFDDVSNMGSKFDDATAMYEYTPNTFGVDMKYNKYQQSLQDYGPPRFTQLKSEVMFNQKFALSEPQFQILVLKSAILSSTFEGKLVKARKNLDSSAVNLDRSLFRSGDYMSAEMMHAIMLYCCFDDLRNDLMCTYYRTQHMNETEKDCRRRHYGSYYNWAKLLYTAIMAFGTDLYDNSHGNRKNGKRKHTYFYHNISKPILFTNFNSSFFAPTSVTTSKNVAIVHMPSQARDGIVLELDTNNVDWTTPYYLNISIFGANPSDCERIFCGGASLGIHNIISIYHYHGMSNLCNYTSAITLLRCIIGDSYNMAMEDDEFDYTELLDEFDHDICKHLEWLIDHQTDLYKSNKNINDFKNYSSDVPLYISLVLNAWCKNKEGIVQLNMNLLRRLPKPLQDKFVCESMENDKDLSLNWSNLFNLFPKCSKIWMKGLYFNKFLCEKYIELLCSEQITQKKYAMNGIVFSCSIEKHWKEWVQTAKGHSSIIKQMGWLITASPPKTTAYGSIETGRVSFIKRMVN